MVDRPRTSSVDAQVPDALMIRRSSGLYRELNPPPRAVAEAEEEEEETGGSERWRRSHLWRQNSSACAWWAPPKEMYYGKRPQNTQRRKVRDRRRAHQLRGGGEEFLARGAKRLGTPRGLLVFLLLGVTVPGPGLLRPFRG